MVILGTIVDVVVTEVVVTSVVVTGTTFGRELVRLLIAR